MNLSLTLSLYPNMSGLCFAAFEDKLISIDWGIKSTRKTGVTLLEQASLLLAHFKPGIILLPARAAANSAVNRLHTIAIEIEKSARAAGVAVYWYSRPDIQDCFLHYGATSKNAIARVIADILPEFGQHLPPIRKLWMSEDYRMGIFDAVSLIVTHEHAIQKLAQKEHGASDAS